VNAQNDDGHWDTKKEIFPSDITDTASALLFLRRGVVPVGPIFTSE
jgi:hypothetical protein